jgi:hypothetical protein
VNEAANERTDRRSDKSSSIATTDPDDERDAASFLQEADFSISVVMSFTAAFPLSKDRQARITVAPFDARIRAVALPMPARQNKFK